ncbi:peptidase M14 [Hafnia paralvei]|uniref:peptidase M14 n=1 Tax=Hafnia paralvei TaxID=546367 RepID=UPI0037520F19
MAVEWMDVADNAVKIGLGSLLTIFGGWMTLKLTHQNEIRKEAAVQQVRNTNKKIERYIQFLSMSQSLMQTYLFKECEGSSDDYLRYLRIHNEITITSSESIRIAAFELQHAVSKFIFQNKAGDIELIDALRDHGRDSVSKFQFLVNEELKDQKKY